MKINFSKKLLFIFGLFICFIILNSKPSFAYDMETDYILSSDYNTSWVESYLDLDMNISDGVKSLIDSHQDYFNITSSDLGQYWILLRFDYTDSSNGTSKYCYLYYSSKSEINIRYTNDYVTDNNYLNALFTYPNKRYQILFVEDGIYTSSDLSNLLVVDPESSQIDACWFGLPSGDNFTRTFIASNHGIKSYPGSSLLFQQPTLKTATTLAPVIQREKTKGTLQVVLTEIIQILPLIIVVLVSLVGLRKALKMLFTVLRRS